MASYGTTVSQQDGLLNYREFLEYIKSMNVSVVDVRTGREVWVNDTIESVLPRLASELYNIPLANMLAEADLAAAETNRLKMQKKENRQKRRRQRR